MNELLLCTDPVGMFSLGMAAMWAFVVLVVGLIRASRL